MKFLALLLLVFAITITLFAQRNTGELDQYLTRLSANDLFNGNVLIAEGGRIAYEKSFGYSDFEKRKPNSAATTFPIASITKTFTATAILQLQQAGKLQVNDPVKKYLPEFPYPHISIRNLLSHTSGLRSYDMFFDSLRKADPSRVFINADILARYAQLKLPLLYEPGDAVNYDNINFIFLAILVERVSGMRFSEYLTKHILKPAGMTNTILPEFSFYHYSEKERRDLANLYWYPHLYSTERVKADTVSFISTYWHSYNFKGAGEIISSLRDLLRYDEVLSSGILLDDGSLKQIYTPAYLNNGKVNGGNFGFAWVIQRDTTFGRIVKSSGGMIGLRSTLLRNLTKRQTIIVIDNTQNESDPIASNILKIINGQHVAIPGRSLAREFGRTLVSGGRDEGLKIVEAYRKDPTRYSVNENEINDLGYDLMQNNKLALAVEVFRLNKELFPDSWNVYDSYGEALLKSDRKEEAVKMYQKSMQLNPANENGRKVLDQILSPR